MSRNISDPSQNLNNLIEGNERRRKGDLNGALLLYKQALAKDKMNVDLHVAIARLHFMLTGNPGENGENFKAAVTWMEKAITLEPNDAYLYTQLAEFLWLGLNEYERATSAYRKAIDSNPQLITAYTGLASLYGVPDEVVTLDEAIAALQFAALIEPDDPNIHGRLAELLFESRNNLAAEQEWRRALLCSKPLSQGYVASLRKKINQLEM